MNLMIVDDEPLEREVLSIIIKRENFRISQLFEAKNGVDAVDLAKNNRIDVVLMDIKMPVMNGLTAAEMIKNNHPDCQIIFLSAYDDHEFTDQMVQLGTDDYLLKPAHPNEIKQALIKYIPVAEHPVPSSLRASCKHDGIIKIIEYIEDNLHLDLNLEMLSNIVHLNQQYISRLFKQETGLTITQYITVRRLEKAKQYLSYSHETVTEISEKCGFSDPNYFTRVFKKYEGITPTKYQQQAFMQRKKRINSFNNFIM
jgi:two-component system, response regulator YesN